MSVPPLPETHEQYVDTITLPASDEIDTDDAQVAVSAELMKNQTRASPVDATETLVVVEDSEGYPLLFSIGTDNEFWFIRHDEMAGSGFSTVDLTKGFSGYDSAVDFDVSQDRHGKLSVAVALSRADESGDDVFVASDLSNSAVKTDWSTFHSWCDEVDGIDDEFGAHNVTIGTTDDGEPAFTIAEGTLGSEECYYQIDERAIAQRMEFPENVRPGDLDEVAIGYAFGQRGKFFLYEEGDSQTLTCLTIGDEMEGSEAYDYSPQNAKVPEKLRGMNYNTVTTALGTKTDPFVISSDVYVGTNSGVYLFSNAKAGRFLEVTDEIADVHELIVKQDDGEIAVWAMASPNRLYYIHGTRSGGDDPTYEWSEPVLFDESTVHLAPIRNRERSANEVFAVTADQKVNHYWQSPQSTLWNERTIKVADEEFIHDFDSFTTQITLEDGNGVPLPGEEVEITSSQWTYAEVNGSVYSLDTDVPATVTTDETGTITIVESTDDICSPIFHVTAAALEKTLNVYPNGKIQDAMSDISSRSDLETATTQDGRPVLEGAHTDAVLDGVAQHVQHLANTGSNHMAAGQADSHTFITVTEAGQKATGTVTASQVAEDVPSGPQTDGGFFGAIDSAFHSIGDFFRHLGTAIEAGIAKIVRQGERIVTHVSEGVSFFFEKVEDALEFVMHVGEEVVRFALDTVDKVYKALSWVFEQIEVGLEKFIAWVGYLFSWDDIWETHNVIASMVTSGLDYAADNADRAAQKAREHVDEQFQDIESRLDGVSLPDDVKETSPKEEANQSRQDSPAMSLKQPAANRTFHHVRHNGLAAGTSSSAAALDEGVTQFVEEDLIGAAEEIGAALGEDVEMIGELFDSSTTMEDVIAVLGKLVNDAIIKPVHGIIDGALDLVGDIIRFAKDLLTSRAEIPFLSSFYEWLTGQLGETEEFTVVNAISLVIAIPYTVIFKIAKGRAPFENGSHGLDDPQLFENLVDESSTEPTTFATDGGVSVSPQEAYTKYGGSLAAVANILQSFTNLARVFNTAGDYTEPDILPAFDYGLAGLTFGLAVPLPEVRGQVPGWTRLTGWGIGLTWTTVAAGLEHKGIKPPDEVIGAIKAGIHSVTLVMYLVSDVTSDANPWTYVGDVLTMGGYTAIDIGGAIKRPSVAMIGSVSVIGGAVVVLTNTLAAMAS